MLFLFCLVSLPNPAEKVPSNNAPCNFSVCQAGVDCRFYVLWTRDSPKGYETAILFCFCLRGEKVGNIRFFYGALSSPDNNVAGNGIRSLWGNQEMAVMFVIRDIVVTNLSSLFPLVWRWAFLCMCLCVSQNQGTPQKGLPFKRQKETSKTHLLLQKTFNVQSTHSSSLPFSLPEFPDLLLGSYLHFQEV